MNVKVIAVIVCGAGLFFAGYFTSAKSGRGDVRAAYAGVISNLDASQGALRHAQDTVAELSNKLAITGRAIDNLRGERDRAAELARKIIAENIRTRNELSNVNYGLSQATGTVDDIDRLIDRASVIAGSVPKESGE